MYTGAGSMSKMRVASKKFARAARPWLDASDRRTGYPCSTPDLNADSGLMATADSSALKARDGVVVLVRLQDVDVRDVLRGQHRSHEERGLCPVACDFLEERWTAPLLGRWNRADQRVARRRGQAVKRPYFAIVPADEPGSIAAEHGIDGRTAIAIEQLPSRSSTRDL